MLTAKYIAILLFVSVAGDSRVTLIDSVKNVSSCCCTVMVFFHSYMLFPAGCKSDFECRDDQACINRECQNPCLFKECGTNAICEAKNHKANCFCPPYHDGDPYKYCEPYECLVDPDCPDTLTCRERNCVDPCKCAINADCTRRNHRGICNCFTGYTGDPYGYECTPSKNISKRMFGFFLKMHVASFQSRRQTWAAEATWNAPANWPA